MARFSTILPVFLASEALVLLLGTFQPTVASWILGASQVFPFPFQGNAPATAGLLGAILGFALSFLFEPGQVQRTYARTRTRVGPAAPRISRRHSIIAPQVGGGYRPLPPAFKYLGGKSRVAPKILSIVPKHRTWVEPFAGAASVTLAKPPSQKEVINDRRSDLVRFFKHIKAGRPIKPASGTHENFIRIRDKAESTRTPGEFYTLQSKAFAGKYGEGYNYSYTANARGKLLNSRLARYSERLKNTTILNQDYRTVVKEYDSPKTVIYLDPPYKTQEDQSSGSHYGQPLISLKELASITASMKGKAIISLPDQPQTREVFERRPFRIKKLTIPYSTRMDVWHGEKPTKELLITNYKPETETG
jgi:DNA adenine methylase